MLGDGSVISSKVTIRRRVVLADQRVLCSWSIGNTCTDWCDNGNCQVKPSDGCSYKNQVCCVGHPSDSRIVQCGVRLWVERLFYLEYGW